MAISSVKNVIYLLVIGMTALTGCAPKSVSTSGMKVGMHIDAVLEFVVEYPLKWKKDRRLEYGRNEGEVRWTHTARTGAMLQVTSHYREYQTNDLELELALEAYPGLTETLREQVDLPGGEAWHVTGETLQTQLDLYLILRAERAYVIALQTPLGNFEDYAELMEKVILSFQRLSH